MGKSIVRKFGKRIVTSAAKVGVWVGMWSAGPVSIVGYFGVVGTIAILGLTHSGLVEASVDVIDSQMFDAIPEVGSDSVSGQLLAIEMTEDVGDTACVDTANKVVDVDTDSVSIEGDDGEDEGEAEDENVDDGETVENGEDEDTDIVMY